MLRQLRKRPKVTVLGPAFDDTIVPTTKSPVAIPMRTGHDRFCLPPERRPATKRQSELADYRVALSSQPGSRGRRSAANSTSSDSSANVSEITFTVDVEVSLFLPKGL